MSLSNKIMSIKQNICQCSDDKKIDKNQKNKQQISLLTNKINCKYKPILRTCSKETPLCTCFPGSYTVEAAVVLPVFLWCMIFIFFFFRVFMVSAGIRSAMEVTARSMALYGAQENEQAELVTAMGMCNGMILAKGVPIRFVQGGLTGIDYGSSDLSGNAIHLVASYDICIPLGILGTKNLSLVDHVSSRRWIGWDPREEEGEDCYVYITERGTAYHSTLSCAYLNPTIRSVPYENLEQQRNESGGKYSSCPSCKSKKNHGAFVYITNYGSVYHSRLDCSGLKRTIYRVQIQDADGYTPCSKCVDVGE